ncbi:hypothetical protein BN948_02502 [Hydrogenophaga intermedia]|uniref:Sodium:solute symporter n=1 Tax=Hydrogenophaga intermedia TaxID=65786 RepID=A0A1L1PEU5_HYDIT|nr:hypothetical protein BN948_02502 [Hydrogenophaga intermedia]
MSRKGLNPVQVAALLVSASYGIGFLFGSGEMALQHGMGASVYGLATAVGMLLLAMFARRLWRTGEPIWNLFGRAYGSGLGRCVALLSLIWMAGVLAAQVHGGVAIVKLLGLGELASYVVVLGAIFGASRLDLSRASSLFTFFLALSGLVFVYVLLTGPGGSIYVRGPAQFLVDLSSFRPAALLAIVVAVVVLVCTGGDYHQFVLAAKTPRAAVIGCLLAGTILTAISFVPASVVLGLQAGGQLTALADPKQAIPVALLTGSRSLGLAAGPILLIGLSVAALGCGAAILRAMADALRSSVAGEVSPTRSAGVALLLGALLAARGQGIIETMVSVNVVYIGSIAVVFVGLLTGRVLTSWQAGIVVASGFLGSVTVYVFASLSSLSAVSESDLVSLGVGLLLSLAAFLFFLRRFPHPTSTRESL